LALFQHSGVEWNGKYRDGIRKFLKKRDGWETWHSGYKVRQTFMPGRASNID